MRDMLHVCGLFSLFAFLAMSFPSKIPVPTATCGDAFAEFVQLSAVRHDAVLEVARTSWQVRSEARSRPSVGRLDADAPLLADSLPPPAAPVYRDSAATGAPLPRPDATIYSFMPATAGAALPDYAPGKGRAAAPSSGEAAFSREEMLSTENSPILKELMQ